MRFIKKLVSHMKRDLPLADARGSFHISVKGFTLIELLVVIGVLAVVAAGVVALINPQDKLLQAGDSKVQSDIGQVATALQSYAAQNATGSYPATGWAAMSTAIGSGAGGSGELVAIPVSATNVTYTYQLSGTTACLHGTLRSRKYVQTAVPAGCGGAAVCNWKWSSLTGVASVVTTAGCP